MPALQICRRTAHWKTPSTALRGNIDGHSTRKERRGMTNAMMMDRATMGVQGMAGMSPSNVGMPSVSPTGSNYVMVPRCTYRFEKVQGGLKITCVCDDPMARSMMQNLCTALMGGMVSCCCTLNGM